MKQLKTGFETLNTITELGFETFTHLKEVKGHEFKDGYACASAAMGHAMTGKRTMLILSGFELLKAHPILTMISGCRLPMIIINISSSISSPISNKTDYSDFFNVTSSGCVQMVVSNLQELFNTIIKSIKISEEIHLPIIISMSKQLFHGTEPLQINLELAKKFIKNYEPAHFLNYDSPLTLNVNTPQPLKFREEVHKQLKESPQIIRRVSKEFNTLTGQKDHDGVVETVNTERKNIIICYGHNAEPLKALIHDKPKYGLIKIITLVPFPTEQIKLLTNNKKITIIDYTFKPDTQSYILEKLCNTKTKLIIKEEITNNDLNE